MTIEWREIVCSLPPRDKNESKEIATALPGLAMTIRVES